MRTAQCFLQKANVELADPAIPLLSASPQEERRHKCTPTGMFKAARGTAATRWKWPKCPSTDEGFVLWSGGGGGSGAGSGGKRGWLLMGRRFLSGVVTVF